MDSANTISYTEITRRALLKLGISHGVHIPHKNDSFTATFYLPRHKGFDEDSKCCQYCTVNTVSEKAYNYLKEHQLLPIGMPTPGENNVRAAATRSFCVKVSNAM